MGLGVAQEEHKAYAPELSEQVERERALRRGACQGGGNRRFWLPNALRVQTKAPYKNWFTVGNAQDAEPPRRARTVRQLLGQEEQEASLARRRLRPARAGVRPTTRRPSKWPPKRRSCLLPAASLLVCGRGPLPAPGRTAYIVKPRLY
jgi:hypothetical protein